MCIICIVVSIYGTKTRSVWIAVAMMLIMFVIDKAKFRPRLRKETLGRIFVVLAVFILFAVIFRNQLQTMFFTISSYLNLAFDRNNQYVSRVVRVENLKNGLIYIKNNPLVLLIGNGLGFGNLFSVQHGVTLSYGAVWNAGIDNQYLSVVLETGIWGLIPIIIIPIYAFIHYFKSELTSDKVGYLVVVLIALLGMSFNIFGWRISTFLYFLGIFMTNGAKKLNGRKKNIRYSSKL